MGPYLSTPVTEKRSSSGNNSKISFGVSAMQGWRVSMEDAHLTNLNIDESTSCFGVFDGHGGHEVSLFISRHFGPELVLNPHFQNRRIEQALSDTFVRLDALMRTKEGKKELYRLQRDLPTNFLIDDNMAESAQFNAGCTAVVALIRGNMLYVANAGDSRCVLARNRRAINMSQDHKPELENEFRRIKDAGGSVIDGRINGNLNLSRSLGDFNYKDPSVPPERHMITACPELKVEQLGQEDDFIVIGCDGIWDILTSQQCVDFVYDRLGRLSLEEIARQICDRCLARSVDENLGRGCDNMSVIIVTWKKPIN
ncbi:unnamed protein product [Blepharisma stoltei]|uniref:PPM-type phosphatase domain-containing protein n=1 Tax=Blepharisma stoltei TaxID=1481888 RepID=A0AAU9JT30_9CILI|nr:unnamed protein product [Blepharisma stoltei]